MPKLKRSSTSHRAFQAKRRKQKQRQDPHKQLHEQDQNTAARKEVRLDPTLRQEEQDVNTAACR